MGCGQRQIHSPGGCQGNRESSWSVAEAHGYIDGEVIPIELAEEIIARITATIDVPVTVDFEAGIVKMTVSWPITFRAFLIWA